jgi:hypothetical protein
MTFTPVIRGFGIAVVLAGASGLVAFAAEDPRATSAGKAAATPRPSSSTSKSGARGPLPDPALLDGSKEAPEKKSDQGMIGDFELPGDENARSGKVGGPQNPNQQQGGGGQGQQNGMPMGLPQGGGSGGQQAQNGQPPPGAQGSSGQQGPQNPDAAGKQVAGGGDQGAQPQGTQVGELAGDPSGQQSGGPASGEKPPQVAIGDSAMRIETSAAAQAGVVGAQQQIAGKTQQHEKGTGTGGKGPTGAQGGNRVEKGRAIPAGL